MAKKESQIRGSFKLKGKYSEPWLDEKHPTQKRPNKCSQNVQLGKTQGTTSGVQERCEMSQ